MSGKTAALVGATGLIGTALLKQLLDDPYFTTVKILIRHPVTLSHSKLEKKLVDFEDSDSLLVALNNTDVIFCAVGTTQKKVQGDKAAYRKVDLDIPVQLARLGKMTGAKTIVIVSSVGANEHAKNFYLKLKGEMETAVAKEGIPSVYFMQPSMLLGNRHESRPTEKIMQALMKTLAFLIPRKYKPVKDSTVAAAMIKVAKESDIGVHRVDGF
jgi:uncharacterized protein YbjT (DUF2867 family)